MVFLAQCPASGGDHRMSAPSCRSDQDAAIAYQSGGCLCRLTSCEASGMDIVWSRTRFFACPRRAAERKPGSGCRDRAGRSVPYDRMTRPWLRGEPRRARVTDSEVRPPLDNYKDFQSHSSRTMPVLAPGATSCPPPRARTSYALNAYCHTN